MRKVLVVFGLVLLLGIILGFQNCGKKGGNSSSSSQSPATLEQALSTAIPLTPAKIAGGKVCRSSRTFDFYTSWGQYTGSEALWYSMQYNSDFTATLTTATVTTGRSYSYGNWEIDSKYHKMLVSNVGSQNTLRAMAAFNAPEGGQVIVDQDGRVWQCCDDIYGTYKNCNIPP